MHTVSANAESEAQGGRYLRGLLEVTSLEMPAESVGTVAGVQSWRQRVPDFRRCWQRSYEHLMMCVWNKMNVCQADSAVLSSSSISTVLMDVISHTTDHSVFHTSRIWTTFRLAVLNDSECFVLWSVHSSFFYYPTNLTNCIYTVAQKIGTPFLYGFNFSKY